MKTYYQLLLLLILLLLYLLGLPGFEQAHVVPSAPFRCRVNFSYAIHVLCVCVRR